MDIKTILKFLFPEYQIIESVQKHGFIAKKHDVSQQAAEMAADFHVQYAASDAYSNAQSAAVPPSRNPDVNGKFPDADVPRYKGKAFEKAARTPLNADFDWVRQQVAVQIVGQGKCLDDLLVAFKRPLVAGYDGVKPRNTLFLLGGAGSGRHTIMEKTVEQLTAKKLLNHDGISRVDLSLYPAAAQQSLFLADLYKALYDNSDVILFDHFENCPGSMLDVIIQLVVQGEYKLSARYAVQNNNLVEATGVLMQSSVDALSAKGKYFVFISAWDEQKITDLFGSKFMESVGDIVRMGAYSKEELLEISGQFLGELKARCRANLSFVLAYDDSLVGFCAGKYKEKTGLPVIRVFLEEVIYKALSELKLRNAFPPLTKLVLFVQEGRVMIKIGTQTGGETIALESLLPQKYSSLEAVKKELDAVVGLSQVKAYVLDWENDFKVQKMREEAGYKTANVSKHMIFTGNPGTGKTTIARIVAKYLKAIGVLSVGQLREVTRADLVGQYVGHTAKLTGEVIRSALGGVLFIDEAYALCRDKHDPFGLEAIDALVKGMEDYRDDLVVILAGYQEEMADFLKINSGLQSRFPHIIDFPDYTAGEMGEIAEMIARSKGYRMDEACREPLLRLFEKSQIRGRNDSGNGRLVRNVIEGGILAQSKRLSQNPGSDMGLLLKEDFPFEETEQFDLEKTLQGIIGLDGVKDFVRTQYQLLLANEKRRKAGIQVDTTQSLNMIFTGNPGTGKTTMARVMASMLKEMGLLKKGHLVETDRGGLVAEYAGQTGPKTEEVFRNALGGILFIDEAYALARDTGFGLEAIDTLVKLIEDYRGEILVVLAGYKKEMADFLKANSGLASRFPLVIDFPDYTGEELYQIALKMTEEKGFMLDGEAKDLLKEQVHAAARTATAHSGNGRMVRNLVEQMIRNQSARIALTETDREDLTKILSCDMEMESASSEEYDLEAALGEIIGLSEVKSYVRSLYARLRLQHERKKLGLPVDASQTLHMIFKGNPGTGKTMVARIIADVLYHIGVIKTRTLVETDRAGLVAGYVGQTALKTTEKVTEALDGVLFIDEAYALSQGGANDFGREAIDTMVKLMDDHRARLVVILAGYSTNMDHFLKANPGLKSRFPNIIEFADYRLEELMQIAEAFYRGKGYVLGGAAMDKMASVLREAMGEEAFGNGRYVRNLFEKSVNQQALRLSSDQDLTREELMTIEAADIERV